MSASTEDRHLELARKLRLNLAGQTFPAGPGEADRLEEEIVAGAFREALDDSEAEVKRMDEDVEQFNDGFAAYGNAELSEDDEPAYETNHDTWRIGWAWAAFDHHKKRIAELEAERDLYVELWEEYGEHGSGCFAGGGDQYHCKCGYRDATTRHAERFATRTRKAEPEEKS